MDRAKRKSIKMFMPMCDVHLISYLVSSKFSIFLCILKLEIYKQKLNNKYHLMNLEEKQKQKKKQKYHSEMDIRVMHARKSFWPLL